MDQIAEVVDQQQSRPCSLVGDAGSRPASRSGDRPASLASAATNARMPASPARSKSRVDGVNAGSGSGRLKASTTASGLP